MTRLGDSCISARVRGSRRIGRALLAGAALWAVPAAARPNVVLIMTDQWRAQDVGYAGNRQVETPNIDALARQSVNFATAVASTPVCAPTRASLLTGQYATQTGVFYNDRPLPSRATTLAEVLRDAGYQTALIGKWHLDGSDTQAGLASREHAIPAERRQGFQYWKAGEATHKYWQSVYFDAANRRQVWPGYDAAAQAVDAQRYIAEHKRKPFFLMLSLGPPHDPYDTAPPADRARYAERPIALRPNVPAALREKATAELRGYYAHIAALDRLVGDIARTLATQGVAENTILIFTSDHGDMLQSQGQELKQKPWDESIRVPFLLRYPGKLAPRTVDQPFATPDIMPTLLDLAGVAIPRTVAGQSYAPAARSGARIASSGALLLLPTPFGNWNFAKGGRAYRGIRTERYTYSADRKGAWLLYDNLTDPYQQTNLANTPGARALQAQLAGDMQALQARIGDRFEAPQCYMDRWQIPWNPKDRPTDPSDATCG